MAVFNISIWTGLVGEGVGMVAKWQHGKVYFQEKGKVSLTKIVLVFTFAYFVSENLKKKKEGESLTEMVGRECSDWSWQDRVGWLVGAGRGWLPNVGNGRKRVVAASQSLHIVTFYYPGASFHSSFCSLIFFLCLFKLAT